MLAVADPGTASGGAAPGANTQRVASWFTLHPSPSRRAEIVRRPALFGRPHVLEFLTAGLLAGAAMLLITQLVLSLGGADIVQSDRIARSLVFAGLGAYAGASLVRAAGTGNLLRRTSLLLAVATVVGVTAGYLGSVERTGLVRFAASDAVTAGVTALLAGGAVVVLTADLVRDHPPRGAVEVAAVVLFCATAGALAANATLAVSQLAGNGVLGLFREELPSALVDGHAAHALGLLVLAAAIVALLAVRPWRQALVVPVLTGAFAGLIATAWMIGVHLRTGMLAGDDAKVRFYYACVWLGVAASVAVAMACAAGVRGRTPAGVIAGAVAATVASAGFVVRYGVRIELGGVLEMLALVGGVATVIGLPLAALVSGLVPAARRPTGVAQPPRVRPRTVTAAIVLTAVATALVVGLVPRTVMAAPPTPGGDVSLSTYLRSDMPKIAGPRDAAVRIASEPSATPQSRSERLLKAVLPLYDSAAAAAEEVTGRSELVQTLNNAALAMLRAERAAFAAEADLVLTQDQADVLELSVASARAREAQIRWQQALAVAKATGSSARLP